jgi:hypothetical protein
MAEKSTAQKLFIKPGRRHLLVDPPAGWETLLGFVPDGAKLWTEIGSGLPIEPGTFHLTNTGDEFQDRDEGEGVAGWILVFVQDRQGLERQLPRLLNRLIPGGMLWVAYHKGSSKVKTDIHRDSINAYAQSLGMTGVAMISIDADWSALRLKAV